MYKDPKYRVVRLYDMVYVSSTGECSILVQIRNETSNRKYTCSFSLRSACLNGRPRTPKYLVQQVMELARDAYAKRRFVFYEQDQNRNPRYEGLRYFDAEEVARLLAPREAA